MQLVVLLYIYPDAVPADVEKTILARVNTGIEPQFVKEISRRTTTLGAREAKEVVQQIDMAGARGGKEEPGGQKLPNKMVEVTRYATVENRVLNALQS